MFSQSIKEAILKYGYVLLQGIDTKRLESIAESLGPVEVDSRNPERVREIRPENSGDIILISS